MLTVCAITALPSRPPRPGTRLGAAAAFVAAMATALPHAAAGQEIRAVPGVTVDLGVLGGPAAPGGFFPGARSYDPFPTTAPAGIRASGGLLDPPPEAPRSALSGQGLALLDAPASPLTARVVVPGQAAADAAPAAAVGPAQAPPAAGPRIDEQPGIRLQPLRPPAPPAMAAVEPAPAVAVTTRTLDDAAPADTPTATDSGTMTADESDTMTEGAADAAPVAAATEAPAQPADAVPATDGAVQVAALDGPPDSRIRLPFEDGSAQVPETAAAELRGLADRLAADDSLRLQLLAYAAGTAETASQARRLSLSRALAVRALLIENGVRSTRMDVRALGNKVPDGPADRVDVVLVGR